MMKNKKNVPDIRFKGFAEEWKEQRLGDSADIIGGGTPDTSNREYWDGDIDWYSPAEIGDKVFVDGSKRKITELGLKESSAKILPIGTVLFSSRAGIGSTAILAEKGATNQGFQSIIPHKGNLDTYFIFSRTRELKKYGETNGAGSTFIEISGKQMESMPIINPEIDEQQAIGNYFQNIDRLINTSQTKLDKLKNIKKACLEKMFPRNGSTTPELRFKGFSEEWKEQQLGDCADIVGGGTPDTANSEYWDGDIDWYSPAEIGDKIFIDRSKRKITQLGLKESSAKVLPIGTVLFSSRAGIGSAAILAKEGATNQGFQSIIPHNGKLDTYFIFSRTRELKKYGETNGAGSTFIEVSGKQMESMPIINPEIDEQKAIGIFFKNLDRLTAKTEQQINKLKNIKKACLDKMFVNE